MGLAAGRRRISPSFARVSVDQRALSAGKAPSAGASNQATDVPAATGTVAITAAEAPEAGFHTGRLTKVLFPKKRLDEVDGKRRCLIPHVERALMTVAVEGNRVDAVIKALRGDPAITTLHSTNGRWDIVVELRADSLEAFDRVLARIRLVEGISQSETSLLLSTFK